MDTPLTPLDAPPERRRWLRPSAGGVVLAAVALVVLAIAVGVYTSRSDDHTAVRDTVTIAQLQADPDRDVAREVTLSGAAEDVREVPYLSRLHAHAVSDPICVNIRCGVSVDGEQTCLVGA